MAQRWLTTDNRNHTPAPFGVHFSVGVPSSGTGNNGDYAFCYGNDGLGIYKKIDGIWLTVSGGGGGFLGFNSTNSQQFDLTTTGDTVTVTAFTFTESDGLQVEVDGIVQYEGAGYTRNAGLGTITFDDEITASVASPVHVFVGKYSTIGFAGFSSINSELFEVATSSNWVEVTNFTIGGNDQLRVEVDGIVRYEGVDWTRMTPGSIIYFNEDLNGTPEAPVRVFVGRYS
jgi:hypothetical protein